jgi:poly(A) polymerase
LKKFEQLIPKSVFALGEIFSKNSFEIALVGGCVRDLFFEINSNDYDFATNAYPDKIIKLVDKWADSLWTTGEKFGTIGVMKNGLKFEITTFRSDKYKANSRKPQVIFGDTLIGDLSRRDFTINAMAIKLPNLELIDEFGGLNDLSAKILKTPIDPETSFNDDPLRIMRLFRFIAQLDFLPDKLTIQAAGNLKDRLDIISRERISQELEKLIMSDKPIKALDAMTTWQIMHKIIPELPKLKLEIDERGRHKDNYWHSLKVLEQGIILAKQRNFADNLTIRLACLLHDIGKSSTRKFNSTGKVTFYGHDIVGSHLAYNRLKALRFNKKVVQDVAKLVKLHMRFYGYAGSVWTDSAARRYAHDAGDLLDLLHILSRADCTTSQQKLKQKLSAAYDDLEARIKRLNKQEEIRNIRPSLNGHEIMEILHIKSGATVGKAYKYMLNYRFANGEISKSQAKKVLLNWWQNN